MADLTRQRTRPTEQGMSSATGVEDALARKLIAELQERISALSQKPRTTVPASGSEDTVAVLQKEVATLQTLVADLSNSIETGDRNTGAVGRSMSKLHAFVISNALGETIPAYSVMRITAYNPDTDVYTVGKPQGPSTDRLELLLFTSHFPIETGSLGIAYKPSERLVKARYEAHSSSFTPTVGKLYTTKSASWQLFSLGPDATTGFCISIGSVAEEWNTTGGLTYVRSVEGTTPPDPTKVAITNLTGAVIPLGGIVWLNGIDADETRHHAKYCDVDCRTDVGLAVAEVAIGGDGYAWVNGIHPCVSSKWSDAAVMDRVGPQANAFGAMPYDGPFTVKAKLDSPLLLVEITGKRLDYRMVDTGGQCDGEYQVIIWGDTFTLTPSSTPELGLVTVED